MITKVESQELSQLIDANYRGILAADEQAELNRLTRLVEQDELVQLAPAFERMTAEAARIERHTLALQKIARRSERLVLKLEKVKLQTEAEKHSINNELSKVMQSIPVGPPH